MISVDHNARQLVQGLTLVVRVVRDGMEQLARRGGLGAPRVARVAGSNDGAVGVGRGGGAAQQDVGNALQQLRRPEAEVLVGVPMGKEPAAISSPRRDQRANRDLGVLGVAHQAEVRHAPAAERLEEVQRDGSRPPGQRARGEDAAEGGRRDEGAHEVQREARALEQVLGVPMRRGPAAHKASLAEV